MSGVKLPLVVRKNIRDDFDAKKGELGQKFKDILGEDYSFDVDFPTLFSQADEGYQQDSIGKICYNAIDSLWEHLKRFTDEGDDKIAVENFNTVVSKHSITVVMDEKFKDSYSGCRVTDGQWEVVFKPKGLSTNVDSANEKLGPALDEAMAKANPKALPLSAKMGVKKDWEDQKEELEKKLAKELNDNKITCHVNPEDMWTKIVEARESLPNSKKNDIDIEHCARNLGSFIFKYFDSLLDHMKYDFKNDEMIVEGFLEEVSTKEAWFEMVKEGELKSSYTDTVIEDGKLIGRTMPTKFGVNISHAFEGITKLL